MSYVQDEASLTSISPWSVPTGSSGRSNQSGETHEAPIAGPSTQPPVDDEQDGEHGQHKAKKPKFSRSRQACLQVSDFLLFRVLGPSSSQCRSRKSKCGAIAPDPCPNCIEAKLQCTWPSEDGRSSKARMEKAQQAFLTRSMSGNAQQPDLLSMASGGARVDDGWLERFLAAGQVANSPQGESLIISAVAGS